MLNVNFNIVYTIINILILFFIFRVFLFKRVDKVLKARNDEVENATEAADRKSHDADEAKAKYDNDIQKLEDEKEGIISESREKGYHEYAQIIANAKVEAGSIIDDAKKTAQIESERQRRIYEAEITDMVVNAASKIAAGSHSEQQDNELYNRFIDEAGDEDK